MPTWPMCASPLVLLTGSPIVDAQIGAGESIIRKMVKNHLSRAATCWSGGAASGEITPLVVDPDLTREFVVPREARKHCAARTPSHPGAALRVS